MGNFWLAIYQDASNPLCPKCRAMSENGGVVHKEPIPGFLKSLPRKALGKRSSISGDSASERRIGHFHRQAFCKPLNVWILGNQRRGTIPHMVTTATAVEAYHRHSPHHRLQRNKAKPFAGR